jgi:hypothetical protein
VTACTTLNRRSKRGRSSSVVRDKKKKKWIIPVGKFAIKTRWYLNYEDDASPESSLLMMVKEEEGVGITWMRIPPQIGFHQNQFFYKQSSIMRGIMNFMLV